MRRSRSSLGFTLIELLVVIAIIAILAAILFPVFAKAKTNATRAACLGHIKQLGVAVKMYQDDYGSNYPTTSFYPTGGAISGDAPWGFAGWAHLLFTHGYLKSISVLRCPGSSRQLPAGVRKVRIGYGFNEYIWYAAARNQPFYKESAIPNAKLTLLLADCYYCHLVHDWHDPGDPPGETLPSGFLRVKYADGYGNGPSYFRHGASNVLFADLHATVIPAERFGFQAGSPPKEYPIVYPPSIPYR